MSKAFLTFCILLLSFSAQAFETGTAGFSVRVGGLNTSYRTFGYFLLPGERTTIEAVPNEGARPHFHIEQGSATLPPFVAESESRWRWTAPETPGLYPFRVRNEKTGECVQLHVFVLTPLHRVRNGMLNGYRIGNYPSARPGYDLPKGFIEVTRENEDTALSPHFKLKQFLCKQGGGYPKYLVLQERLLQKLELTLQGVNQSGIAVDGFEIMSGYRTPHYNHAIGNVKYSRHQWGDAADVLIGSIPSAAFVKTVNGIQSEAKLALVGGLGQYKRTKRHGPFIHVDVRGHAAAW